MRIISWNCCGSLKSAEKLNFIMAFEPDLLIIQEIRCNDMSEDSRVLWVSNQKDKTNPKGLGVYKFNSAVQVIALDANPEFEVLQPLRIEYLGVKFNIMSVWAYNRRSQGKYKGRDGMVVDALGYYGNFQKPDCLWLGDFNNGPTIRNGKFWNPVLEVFQKNEMHEVLFPGGNITHKNNKGTLHHIDHCFSGAELFRGLKAHKRLALDQVPSDHVPLVLDLNF